MFNARLHAIAGNTVFNQLKTAQGVLQVQSTLSPWQIFQQRMTLVVVIQALLQLLLRDGDILELFQPSGRCPQDGASGMLVIHAAALGQEHAVSERQCTFELGTGEGERPGIGAKTIE